MNENVIVCIRPRPFSETEIKGGEHCLWQLKESTISSLPPPSTAINATPIKSSLKTPIKPSSASSSATPLKTPIKFSSTASSVQTPLKTPIKATSTSTSATTSKFIPNSYTYDNVFTTESDNYDIYNAVKPMIVSAMNGYNCTIFAYGQTSSGKTFTMKGTGKKNPGIIPLSIQDVFTYIQQTDEREFLLRVSYMEIYNEVINDLLAPENINLKTYENSTQGIYVGGLKEEIVLSLDHVISLISAGEAHRHVGSTSYNLQSSRSHTIFRMIIESKDVNASEAQPVRFSVLNLIDLAGSEKASEGVNAVRNKEGSYINKSLLTLGTVISKLSENATGHIPYRDSKLTRILQNSLSGNSRVAMICTITLASNNFEETHNTLKFASRAKKIENNAQRNEIIDDKALLKQYRHEIAELKLKLSEALTTEKDLSELQSEKEKIKSTNEELSQKLLEAEKHRTHLEAKINNLNKLILVSTSINNNNPKSKSAFVSPSPNTSADHGSLTPSSFNNFLHSIHSPSPSNNNTPTINGLSHSHSNIAFTNNNGAEQQEIIQIQSKMAKLEIELEEKNKKIEFLQTLNQDSALEKIKQLEGEMVQRDMDIALYQKESTRLQDTLTVKEEKINLLELKLKEILIKFKQMESENSTLKNKVKQYEEEMY
ncbi:hypothetical protein DICPUDRAFT_96759 [Dictyostelium purpureum]|uniref:Kinesin-like protein n=1 Tax=Dictyostelium purpureum TaxID=5786 RepID=F0ZAZ0_DICPU|nr:uncharacterized protein DICPUDRAFT_96759 [Dictyostelium purpureum]EGC38883.1 hypothetical protein DICPUDRAFT_96759 [Dictyostelium purpureum]|eukprot:XP_003284563.1 hypothetical protein DICPUDRAFT_96759 [Dictyostelium purpureum]